MKQSSPETSPLCLWKPRIPFHKYLDTDYVSIRCQIWYPGWTSVPFSYY